jgi:hypothetical protein
MGLQYISDSDGKTTGVYIPIEEWNKLKDKLKDTDIQDLDIPEWHKTLVRERVEEYKAKPNEALDFDEAMDDIEKDL